MAAIVHIATSGLELSSTNEREDGQARPLFQFACKFGIKAIHHDQPNLRLLDTQLTHNTGDLRARRALPLLLEKSSVAKLGEKLDRDLHRRNFPVKHNWGR